jgi:hypothetical protein
MADHKESRSDFFTQRDQRSHAIPHGISAAHVDIRRNKTLNRIEHADLRAKVPHELLHLLRTEFEAPKSSVLIASRIHRDDVRFIGSGFAELSLQLFGNTVFGGAEGNRHRTSYHTGRIKHARLPAAERRQQIDPD